MKYKLIIDSSCEEEIVIKAPARNNLVDEIENLIFSYQGNDSLCIFDDNGIFELNFSDIDCITVIGRQTVAIDKNNIQHRLRQRLCEIEKTLPGYFIRINKSTIANEKRILRFKTVFNGSVDAVFKSGYKDYVSRRCFAEIKRRLIGK